MRALPAACCLLIASLALGADAARAQFRLSLPSEGRRSRPWSRTEDRPPTLSEMLLNEMLQWELKLTDEQIDKLEDTESTVKQRHQEEADRLTRLRREAVDASLALSRKMEREQREVMRNILTPVQRDRVRQVEIQLAGPAAFFDPDVQRALRLTGEQTEAMQKVLSEANNSYMEESRRALRAAAPAAAPFPAPGGGAAREKRLKELSQRAIQKLEAQLTAEQKKQWARLVGGPCAAVEKWNRGAFGRLALVVSSFRRSQQPIDTLGPDEVAEKLKDELKLSEEQATRIGNLPEVIAGGHNDERKQIRKQEEEQEKAQAALEARQAGEMAKAMTAVLKPEQQHRLEQVRLQLLGLAAWDDPAVRKALKLTEEQRVAFQKISGEAKANLTEMMMRARRGAGGFGGDIQKRQRLQQRRTAAAYRGVMDRTVAQLTPEQQKQWRELTGPPVRLHVEFARLIP
jgi:hypothetical protein